MVEYKCYAAGVESSSPARHGPVKAGQDTDRDLSSSLRRLSAWFWFWTPYWRVQESVKKRGRGWGSGWNQRYTEIIHDPLLFTSVAQEIF
jgi:hypothetical protein